MTITLYYKDLKHDMDQWSYRVSEGKITDPNVLDDAQLDDGSSSKSLCMRLFEGGVAHLKAIVSSELDSAVTDATDALDLTKSSWVFTFKSTADITTDTKAIAEAFHRFVFLHAFKDWMLIYSPDTASGISALLEDASSEVTNTLYAIDAPTKHRRPKLTDIYKSSVEVVENE